MQDYMPRFSDGTIYFGEAWLPTQLDHQPQPTPVGENCLSCTEPITDGDRGGWQAFTDHGDNPRTVPVHLECLPLASVGHEYGVCECTRYAGQPTRRAAALELWRRMGEKRR